MRTRPQLARVLVLIGLVTLLAVAPSLAGSSSRAGNALTAPLSAPVIPLIASFLAALAGELASAPGPTPTLDCRNRMPHCQGAQLCCPACGFFGCDTYACYDPVDGHCPLFP
jgi:hypothetical protein